MTSLQIKIFNIIRDSYRPTIEQIAQELNQKQDNIRQECVAMSEKGHISGRITRAFKLKDQPKTPTA